VQDNKIKKEYITYLKISACGGNGAGKVLKWCYLFAYYHYSSLEDILLNKRFVNQKRKLQQRKVKQK